MKVLPCHSFKCTTNAISALLSTVKRKTESVKWITIFDVTA